jgi:hypothetical protein
MPTLLEVMPFEATGAGQPILNALDALRGNRLWFLMSVRFTMGAALLKGPGVTVIWPAG